MKSHKDRIKGLKFFGGLIFEFPRCEVNLVTPSSETNNYSFEEEINKFIIETKIINVYDMDYIDRLGALQYVENVENVFKPRFIHLF